VKKLPKNRHPLLKVAQLAQSTVENYLGWQCFIDICEKSKINRNNAKHLAVF
jgi:hypothetical protein